MLRVTFYLSAFVAEKQSPWTPQPSRNGRKGNLMRLLPELTFQRSENSSFRSDMKSQQSTLLWHDTFPVIQV